MKKRFTSFLSVVFTLMALLLGSNVAMALVDDVPQSQTPDNDQKNLKTDLAGTPATEAVVKDSDINDDEIDELIVKFCPFNYNLTTLIETKARQKRVKDYETFHAVMATPISECTTLASISQTATGYAELTIGTHISSAAARMFGRSQTICVKGVSGYTQDTQNTPNGTLMLKVVSRNSTKIKVIPVNGIYVTSEYEVPAIPQGTTLMVMATAGTTSQLIVSPKNQQPVLVSAYLQKKIMNTTIEKEWKEKKKKVPFFTTDIENGALFQFREENEMTKLMGVPGMLKEDVELTGEENCYYEEGVITQLLMKYVTDGGVTYKDLIEMQKMQFGKWSMSDEAYVLCSYDYMADLQNLDFTRVAQTNIETSTTTLGTNVTKFKTPFGTFNFVLCPALDKAGFEGCAMVIDFKNSVHYWKSPNVGENSKEDMSKNGEDPREVDRTRHIKIDCFCLRGYNSMLVGPAEKIYGINTVYENTTIYDFVETVSSTHYTLDPSAASGAGTAAEPKAVWGQTIGGVTWPAAPSDGMLIYLKGNEPFTQFADGQMIVYSTESADYHKYSGKITA